VPFIGLRKPDGIVVVLSECMCLWPQERLLDGGHKSHDHFNIWFRIFYMAGFTAVPKLSNFHIAMSLAYRLQKLGFVPFKSERERFLITLPEDSAAKELIELGPALKGGRFFRPNCAKKDLALIEQFSAFSAADGLKDCYYWSVCLPIRKASFEKLEQSLSDFNRLLNNHFSELRKNHGFEQLVLVHHIRYDEFTDAIDLHAHFICRVPPDHLEQVRGLLSRKFSRADVNVKAIRNPAAALNYMLYGIFNNREMIEWPDHALVAVWQLTQKKRNRYVRTGGAFAKWKREALAANDNVQSTSKAERKERHPVDPCKPRFLARVTAKVRGKRVAALLYERPTEQNDPVSETDMYSTASRRIIQETKIAPQELAPLKGPLPHGLAGMTLGVPVRAVRGLLRVFGQRIAHLARSLARRLRL
jgi:hypothetical protein